MNRLLALLKMGRFFILLAGVVAYATGLALAFYEFGKVDWERAGMGLVLMCLATLAAHYADEYADQDTDALARRTFFSGGSGVLPAGLIPPAWALIAAVTCAAAAVGLAVWWVTRGALQPVVLGMVVVGLIGGWVYSMPPLALERRGVGELDNAILGGFFMPLIAYAAQDGRLSASALLACAPVFLIVFANLMGVHWVDRKADAAVGKRSLVVMLGERTGAVHAGLIGLAYGLAAALTGTVYPPAAGAAVLITLPFGVWVAWRFFRQPGPFYSSLLMVVFMVALAAGWVYAGI